jgi:hypothetical protein
MPQPAWRRQAAAGVVRCGEAGWSACCRRCCAADGGRPTRCCALTDAAQQRPLEPRSLDGWLQHRVVQRHQQDDGARVEQRHCGRRDVQRRTHGCVAAAAAAAAGHVVAAAAAPEEGRQRHAVVHERALLDEQRAHAAVHAPAARGDGQVVAAGGAHTGVFCGWCVCVCVCGRGGGAVTWRAQGSTGSSLPLPRRPASADAALTSTPRSWQTRAAGAAPP